MELLTTIKFLAFYALEFFVIAMVGATLIAGLYQLVRDQARSALSKVRESRVSAHAMAQERIAAASHQREA